MRPTESSCRFHWTGMREKEDAYSYEGEFLVRRRYSYSGCSIQGNPLFVWRYQPVFPSFPSGRPCNYSRDWMPESDNLGYDAFHSQPRSLNSNGDERISRSLVFRATRRGSLASLLTSDCPSFSHPIQSGAALGFGILNRTNQRQRYEL